MVVAVCLPMLSGRGAAQIAPLIANINARQITSLDGQWQVIVDPYDVGSLDYRAQPLKNNQAFYKNYKPQSESELVEYDFDTSGQLQVPGDWNTQRESLLFYEGSVWYKRSFDYAKSPKSRLFLHFGACNYLAAVYLNGQELGQHEGGFTPFDFEITDRVRAHGNFLVLRINNKRGKGSSSHRQYGLVELRRNYPPRDIAGGPGNLCSRLFCPVGERIDAPD